MVVQDSLEEYIYGSEMVSALSKKILAADLGESSERKMVKSQKVTDKLRLDDFKEYH
jgi:hypothetical protein